MGKPSKQFTDLSAKQDNTDAISAQQVSSLQNLFQDALGHHLKGQLSSARDGYEEYLSRLGSLPVVRTNLAAIYIEQLRYTEAKSLLDIALAEAPFYPEALSNRGYLSLLEGNLEEGISYLSAALDANPALLPALTHLIPILRQQNRSAEAEIRLQSALSITPSVPALLIMQAEADQLSISPQVAIANLKLAIEKAQGSEKAELLAALASFLLIRGTDLPQALFTLEDAISQSLSHKIVDLVNKGEILRRLSRRDEALAWVNQCLMQHPNDASLINLKACILQDLGQHQDALTLYSMAIAANPANPQIYANKGFLLNDLGRHHEAEQSFDYGLTAQPMHAGCLHGKALTSFHLARPETALEFYSKAVKVDPVNLNIWDNFLYFLSFVNFLPPDRFIGFFNEYASSALRHRTAEDQVVFKHEFVACTSRPLRVGIVSAEIGSHCVSYFLLSLLRGATTDQFEFYIFPTKDRHAEPRWNVFQSLSKVFQCIEQLSDEQAAELIRSYNLDVVLETSQHMTANRLALMARRLAPVQCHYIGMHGTTGVPALDYFIGDSIVTPDDFSPSFTETLLPLSRTWVAFTPPEELPPLRIVESSSVLRLGCFNNVSKISRDCMNLWAEVLLAIPNSTLTIKDSLRRGKTDHQQSISQFMQDRGIDESRLILLDRVDSWEVHMDLYNDLDIALDTIPLTSGTTTFDALLMGVPLVAFSTPWIGGRLSASIVNGLGHPDWIATSTSEYILITKKLSKNLNTLRNTREKRRNQFLSSELCDHVSLSKSLYSVLTRVYESTHLVPKKNT